MVSFDLRYKNVTYYVSALLASIKYALLKAVATNVIDIVLKYICDQLEVNCIYYSDIMIFMLLISLKINSRLS